MTQTPQAQSQLLMTTAEELAEFIRKNCVLLHGSVAVVGNPPDARSQEDAQNGRLYPQQKYVQFVVKEYSYHGICASLHPDTLMVIETDDDGFVSIFTQEEYGKWLRCDEFDPGTPVMTIRVKGPYVN